MYCPSCSAPTSEGAKFCKGCGLSLTALNQALSGTSLASDPFREREYKRARKQISDGIQGVAVGAAIMAVAIVAYLLIPKEGFYYAISLALALIGIIKLFKSLGQIIDAKVGPKLVDSRTSAWSTGPLSYSQQSPSSALPPAQATTRVSQHLAAQPTQPAFAKKEPAPTRTAERPAPQQPTPPGPGPGTAGLGTMRVNREHSSPLRKPDIEDELMSKLRN